MLGRYFQKVIYYLLLATNSMIILSRVQLIVYNITYYFIKNVTDNILHYVFHYQKSN